MKIFFLLVLILVIFPLNAQTPLYSNIKVNDDTFNSSYIEFAHAIKSMEIDEEGNIYVVYRNHEGIWVAKSVNNGQSYLPSVRVSNDPNANPTSIMINEIGYVYISWGNNLNEVFVSSSTDGGNSFSNPTIIEINEEESNTYIKMVSFGSKVYLITANPKFIYYNINNFIGDFVQVAINSNEIGNGGLFVNNEGRVYFLGDYPYLSLKVLNEENNTLNSINLSASIYIYYGGYTFSESPCGKFIFVGSENYFAIIRSGYKIDVESGEVTEIELNNSLIDVFPSTLYADKGGVLFDAYKNMNQELVFSISYNLGETFEYPIFVSDGEEHSIARNPFTEDIVVVYEKNNNIYTTVYESSFKKIEIIEPTPNLSYCNGASFDLPYTLSSSFISPTNFTVSLSDENGSFNTSTIIGSITTNDSGIVTCILPDDLPSSSNYKLKMESLSNCIESNYIDIEVGTVFNNLPTINIADAYYACLDENSQIIDEFPVVETNLSEDDFNFEWQLNDAILPDETSSSITATVRGNYKVIVTNKITNCSNSKVTMVYIGEPPVVTAEVVSNNFERYQIVNVFAEGIGDYEYRIDNGLWQDDPIFTYVNNGEHILSVRDKFECGHSETNILVMGLEFPLFFTPNGDGINDTWNIFALKNQNAHISIFNRYGLLLKQVKTSGIGWDGYYGGRQMPANDYWFKIEYQDLITQEPKVFVSHFTLKR